MKRRYNSSRIAIARAGVPTIIFNRINTLSSPVRVEWPAGSGQYNPIPAADRCGQSSPNVAGYEAIRQQTGYYHGSQSRNAPPTYYREEDGAWVVQPGYEAANWGNACYYDGDSQNLTGVGDLRSGDAAACEASVSVRKANDACWTYAVTDGFGDLCPATTFCQKVAELHAAGQMRTPAAAMDAIATWSNAMTAGDDIYASSARAHGRTQAATTIARRSF